MTGQPAFSHDFDSARFLCSRAQIKAAFVAGDGRRRVLAAAPYDVPRRSPRITNAQEADWGLQTMKVVQRAQTRLAVMGLVLAV